MLNSMRVTLDFETADEDVDSDGKEVYRIREVDLEVFYVSMRSRCRIFASMPVHNSVVVEACARYYA